MKRARLGLLLVAIGAVTSLGVRAAGGELPSAEVGAPLVRNYFPRDFEPKGAEVGPQVFAIAQGARGLLYFGNNLGVLEHDGAAWRVIPTPRISAVLSLAVDEAGRLFVGTSDDFGALVPDAAGRLVYEPISSRVPAGTAVKDVWQVVPTKDGVYFRTEAALFLLANGAIRAIRPKTRFRLGGLVNGRFFVHQPDVGLVEIAGGAPKELAAGPLFANDKPYVYLRYDDRRLLVGSRGRGLSLVDPDAPPESALTPFAPGATGLLAESLLYSGAVLADGSFAIGTLKAGIVVVDRDGRLVRTFGKRHGLREDDVLALHVDRDGALWAGFNSGASRVETPSPLSSFGEREGLLGFAECVVRHDGRLYVGGSRGLSVLQPGDAGAARLAPVPGLAQLTSALAPASGKLLAANQEGLFEVDAAGARRLGPDFVYALASSRRDARRVFVGYAGGVGSVRVDGERVVDEGRVAGVGEEVIRLAEAADGTLWAGTESSGLLRLSFAAAAEGAGPGAATVTRFGAAEGLPPGYVLPFRLEALAGEVVFGTKRGLHRFDGRRFVADDRLGERFGAGGAEVFRALDDAAGRVWLVSGGAVEVGRFVAGIFRPERTFAIRLPPTADPRAVLTELSPSGGAVSWIAGRGGLFRLEESARAPAADTFDVLVRRVSSTALGPIFGGAARSGAATPELPYRGRDLRFEYAATAFAEPSATRFETRLDGFEADWTPPTDETRKDYTNLPEGRYRFRVRATDLLGRAGREAAFDVRVLPPWYRAPWALALWAAALAALAWGLVQLRVRKLRARTRALEEAVAARTAELAESNRRLDEAQRQLGHLLETASEAQEDLGKWSEGIGREVAATLGAAEIAAFAVEKGNVEPITRSRVTSPPVEELKRLASGARVAPREGSAVLPVLAATGEVVGALVVSGGRPASSWSDAERRLVESFALQLGGALEMRRMRGRLAQAEKARAALKKDMEDHGVATLKTCPRCARCFPNDAARCADDGAPLETPRLLPYRVEGRYRLERVLGEGGMGTVFLAHDERLRRDVALKVVLPELFDDPSIRVRFAREAQAMAQVHHPGVVALFDSGDLADGSAFLVMERISGIDLSTALARFGRGTPAEAARLARRLGAALAAAHAKGVVHRDLKPENVLLTRAPDGFDAKLADFGLAKSAAAEGSLTRSGMVVGTPGYMAPEQIDGRPVDGRTDLYALAVVLYEALTGVPAVTAGALAQIFDEVLRQAPARPSLLRPNLPPEVDAAFAAALEKDPAKRPARVDAWTESLATLLEPLPASEKGWSGRLEKAG